MAIKGTLKDKVNKDRYVEEEKIDKKKKHKRTFLGYYKKCFKIL